MPHTEQPLTGGNTADQVVRIGNTVRKPAGPHTPAVDDLLNYLQANDCTTAPASHGTDADYLKTHQNTWNKALA